MLQPYYLINTIRRRKLTGPFYIKKVQRTWGIAHALFDSKQIYAGKADYKDGEWK